MMDKIEPNAAFVQALRRSLGSQEPDARFVNQLKREIRTQSAAVPARPPMSVRRKWSLALATVMTTLLIAGVLVIGPVNVYGSILKLFGYIPGVGIVNLDEIMVLEHSVRQAHESQSLTVGQGIAGRGDTRLWLTFGDVATPVNGAWLQAADGRRFELSDWRFDPDEAGSRGVLAVFQPLPQGVTETVLALPEGWRIPLKWLPGREANILSVDVITAPPQATAALPSPGSSPIDTASASCIDTDYVGLCIRAVVRTDSNLQVLLEETQEERFTRGSLLWYNAVDPQYPETGPWLMDSSGERYPIDPWRYPQAGSLEPSQQILVFSNVPQGVTSFRLVIPHVTVTTEVQDEITVDLGQSPNEGQVIAIDETVFVAGVPVHFSQAELRGDGANSLRLQLLSDPIAADHGIKPFIFELGRPEGVDDLYGSGNMDGRISIEVELYQRGVLLSGLIRLPVVSAAFQVIGPFEMPFEAPDVLQPQGDAPSVGGNGQYEPLPPAGAMPMDAFRTFGRSIQHGDLLVMTMDDGISRIKVATAERQYLPADLVTLPGYVLALHPHADGGGFDYVAANEMESLTSENLVQLYRLRFADTAPTLLVDRFEIGAQGFAWSFDGKYLAYLVEKVEPGKPYQRQPRLLPACCADAATCQPVPVDTGDQDLSYLNWAPADYRIAAGGAVQEAQFGSTDIFLLTLREDPLGVDVVNLTQSDDIMDLPPAQWGRDGASLFYSCALPAGAVNNGYAYCRNDLQPGHDDVIAESLPWNMHSVRMMGDRQLVETDVVLQDGVFGIRAFDLQTRDSRYLFQWPFEAKRRYPIAVLPTDGLMAAYIPELGGLNIIEIDGQTKWQPMAGDAEVDWLQWVE